MIDFKDIKGQDAAKRAIEVAMTGNHSLVIEGFPGSGKTLLTEAAEGLIDSSKFQAVEFDLFDFADDNVGLLEVPTEVYTGLILAKDLLIKAIKQAEYPVIITRLPCPCGWWGNVFHACICSPEDILQYRRRWIELDGLVHMSISLGWLDWEQVSSHRESEPTAKIKPRIEVAKEKLSKAPKATMRDLAPAATSLLKAAFRQLRLTPRQVDNAISVAQTIAALSAFEPKTVDAVHLAEAIQYRSREK